MPGALLQIAGLAASIAIGLVFMIAGIDKVRHRALLPGVIANYRLLPAALVAPAALLLPVAEILVAAGLLLGSQVAAFGAVGLLLLFAAAVAINIGRGRRHIDCGCGHAGLRQTLAWPLVARNLLMALALTPRLAGAPPLDTADLLVAALAGVAGFVLIQMFKTINALPAQRLHRSRG